MDLAHKETDKILSTNERALKQAYTKAFNDIKTKFTELYGNIDLTAEDGNSRLIEAQKYSRMKRYLIWKNTESVRHQCGLRVSARTLLHTWYDDLVS